jgi:hypothetical protein
VQSGAPAPMLVVISPKLEEWMNPRTRFFRSIALIGALGVGFAACGDNVVNVPETPTISAAPASMQLAPGQTRQIVASLTNVEGGINYSSDNTGVATVSASGLVTGVAEGSATITVSSATQPSLATAVDVNVVADELPPTEDPSITIQSITQFGTLFPVDPNNVTGIVDITLGVERATADSLRVLVGTKVVSECTQRFNTAAGPAKLDAVGLRLAEDLISVVCSINTADYDIVAGQGIPVFANGQFPVRAVLYDNGAVLASATSAPITLNNSDFTVVTIDTPNDAINPTTGLRWDGGAVTAVAVPVIFTGAPVTSVTFNANGAIRTDADGAAGGFSVVFPLTGANNVGSQTDPTFDVTVTTVRTNGQPGPAGDSDFWLPAGVVAFRLDNEAPSAGTFTLAATQFDGWVNATYLFRSGHTGVVDAGVAGVDTTYHVALASAFANPAALTTTERATVAATPEVTNAATLAETLTSDVYVVVARAVDLLGNAVTIQISGGAGTGTNGTIGVDKSAPSIELQSGPADMTVTNNPAALAAYVAAASDTLSGFGATPWRLRDRVATPAGTTCEIGTGVTCAFAQSATGTVNLPLDQGYHTVEIFVVDKANNSSTTITRLALVDTEAPTVSNIQIPTTLVGGQVANFTALAQDNLNLDAAHFYLGYGGLYLQFEPTKDLGSFGASFATETSATLTTTTPFVRGVQNVAAGGAPTGGFISANEAQWQVFDLANPSVFQTNACSFTRPATAKTTYPLSWTMTASASAAVDRSPTTGQPACTTTPTSTQVSVSVSAAGTFDRPFIKVVVLQDVGANHWIPVGETTSASVTDVAGTRTWTYSGITYSPGANAAAGPVTLVVAGMDSEGDVLLSEPVVVTVTAGGP